MHRKLNILQISPLYESVPPKLYGGTERVVSYLTEELIKQGHNVTLFASGDSITKAKLIAPCQSALRLSNEAIDYLAEHVMMLEKAYRIAKDFDIVHSHIDYLTYLIARRHPTPTISTLHGRLDLGNCKNLYNEYSDMPVISISDSQRKPIPNANWKGTIYNGIPEDLYRLGKGGNYLAFIGRISPEKGIDKAIEIAIKAGRELKIAAKVDNVDVKYFNEKIKPLLKHPLIEFIGEISEKEKNDFLGNAYALLFSIDWPEPFGLAMVEAMACGTPIIARKRGSVPEIVKDDINGYMFESDEEAIEAIEKVKHLDRKKCREAYLNHFSASKMANNYLAVYIKLAKVSSEIIKSFSCDISEGDSWKTIPV